jgi:hypothetical protein
MHRYQIEVVAARFYSEDGVESLSETNLEDCRVRITSFSTEHERLAAAFDAGALVMLEKIKRLGVELPADMELMDA